MQGAKQRTKELLDENINDWEDLQQDEHRRCLEFVRRWWKLMSLIAILEDSFENLLTRAGTTRPLLKRKLMERRQL